MDNLDLDNEIKYYEQKLSKVRDEYKNFMICEWNAITGKLNSFSQSKLTYGFPFRKTPSTYHKP
jgi:hypothetical protein